MDLQAKDLSYAMLFWQDNPYDYYNYYYHYHYHYHYYHHYYGFPEPAGSPSLTDPLDRWICGLPEPEGPPGPMDLRAPRAWADGSAGQRFEL